MLICLMPAIRAFVCVCVRVCVHVSLCFVRSVHPLRQRWSVCVWINAALSASYSTPSSSVWFKLTQCVLFSNITVTYCLRKKDDRERRGFRNREGQRGKRSNKGSEERDRDAEVERTRVWAKQTGKKDKYERERERGHKGIGRELIKVEEKKENKDNDREGKIKTGKTNGAYLCQQVKAEEQNRQRDEEKSQELRNRKNNKIIVRGQNMNKETSLLSEMLLGHPIVGVGQGDLSRARCRNGLSLF